LALFLFHFNPWEFQGDHSPGKPGKVREYQSGAGKVGGSEIC